MIIDLLDMWKNPLLKRQTSLLPQEFESYSDAVMASSFDFPVDVKIKFVSDKKFTPAFNYQDLPEVELTNDEKLA